MVANVVLADEINRATAVGAPAPALFIFTGAAWMGPASLGVETFAPTVGKFAGAFIVALVISRLRQGLVRK